MVRCEPPVGRRGGLTNDSGTDYPVQYQKAALAKCHPQDPQDPQTKNPQKTANLSIQSICYAEERCNTLGGGPVAELVSNSPYSVAPHHLQGPAAWEKLVPPGAPSP